MLNLQGLLSLEPKDVSLPTLGGECRELLRAGADVKAALAVRLAIAHKLITSGISKEKSFSGWCKKNVTNADGRPYAWASIHKAVKIGYAKNPEKALAKARAINAEAVRSRRHLIEHQAAVGRSVVAFTAPKVVPIRQGQASLPSNVSGELNGLVRSWEHASAPARKQFLYQIGAVLECDRYAKKSG